MILQLFISFICTLIGFFVFLIPEAGALSVSTQDGIVGLSVPLRTSVSTPNQPIVFQVIKPDGSVVYLSTVTDDSGIGKIDLDHYHTTLSGKYRVSARLESSVNFGNENSFSLFPGKTSTTRSEARLSDIRIEANGENASILTVALKDDFGNAIPNHPVSVISSRSEDIISPINTNVTNSEGRVKFNIRSTSPGQSILTISDIFSIDPVNSNKYVLFERPSLTFVPSTKTSSFLNTLTGNLFADTFSSGNISLKIEAPSRVKVNEFFDITVKAITSSGTPARDYGGTILFSSDDPNADLPLEQTGYTFTGRETRPGEHTFPKATRFANKGFYELVVTDVDRPNIEAKITIEVTDNLNEVPQGTGIKIFH